MSPEGPARLLVRYPSRIRVDEEIDLRLVRKRDATEIFALTERNRAYLRRWLPWVDGTRSVEDTRAFIQRSQEQVRVGQGFQSGIVFRGELVGVMGFVYVDGANRRAEIGYWISEDHQGRGIMTRACRALVDFAFGSLRLNRVEIRADMENRRSRAIPERLGFRQEAVFRGAGWMYDHHIDLVMYSMLRDEWDAARATGAAKP
ncbi:MAG TPA: GNAT family protein [Thermoplasmata archaeon]|nr:GNAT family protein [Thermoplasmata archaeon]